MRYLLLLSALLLVQCHSSKATMVQEPPSGEPQSEDASYPSIPYETMQVLWDSCDYIDFLFYHVNFSMMQDNPSSIRHTLAGIATTPAMVSDSCKADGRIYFMKEGRTLVEADMFISDNCSYYIFLENGKRSYANQLTEDGLQFYRNVFHQIQKQ